MDKKRIYTKIDVIIQARIGSSRLPKKVIADLGGYSMLEFLIRRIKKCDLINNFILATTINDEDNQLENIGNKLNLKVIRGSEKDVLSRFYDASKESEASTFMRITADCPFLDHKLMNELIYAYFDQKVDYLSNCYPPNLPDGLDLEIFSKEALILAHENCHDLNMREHVTPWIRNSKKFKVGSLKYNRDLSKYRLTVDEPEDLELINRILRKTKKPIEISWEDAIKILTKDNELVKINSKFKRNEGFFMDNSDKLWRRAKKVIPGGNMLLSKRPELFLPNKWPAYFKKTKGCFVWDLDDRKYIDMSLMGVGTN